jgi:hypothetical protein
MLKRKREEGASIYWSTPSPLRLYKSYDLTIVRAI